MTDEEKIIRVKILENFDRELARNGDETLDVPAWIAQEYGIFPEDVGSAEEIREAGREDRTDDG